MAGVCSAAQPASSTPTTRLMRSAAVRAIRPMRSSYALITKAAVSQPRQHAIARQLNVGGQRLQRADVANKRRSRSRIGFKRRVNGPGHRQSYQVDVGLVEQLHSQAVCHIQRGARIGSSASFAGAFE